MRKNPQSSPASEPDDESQSPPLPRLRKVVVANWKATTRVPRRIYLKPEEIDERMKTLQSIKPEIERIELRIQPDVDALSMLKLEMKKLAGAVKYGFEHVDIEVMEVPDEMLRLVRFVDEEGQVIGDRPLTDIDLQEKLV